jgi:AraC-like DNA-binding protein
MSVMQVSLELGYDNPAAFTALFKRILGAPPKDYARGQQLKTA